MLIRRLGFKNQVLFWGICVSCFLNLSIGQTVRASFVEQVELTTAMARFPAVVLANHFEGEHSKKAQCACLCADLMRASNGLLALAHHDGNVHLYTAGWCIYDVLHSAQSLVSLVHEYTVTGHHCEHDEEKIEQALGLFAEHLRKYILPFCESVAATCIAWNHDKPEHKKYLARVEALGSLSRLFSDALVSKKETVEGKLTLGLLVINGLAVLYEFKDIFDAKPSNLLTKPLPVPPHASVPPPAPDQPHDPAPPHDQDSSNGPIPPHASTSPLVPAQPQGQDLTHHDEAPMTLPLPVALQVPAHDEVPATLPIVPVPSSPVPSHESGSVDDSASGVAPSPLPVTLQVPAHDEVPATLPIVPAPSSPAPSHESGSVDDSASDVVPESPVVPHATGYRDMPNLPVSVRPASPSIGAGTDDGEDDIVIPGTPESEFEGSGSRSPDASGYEDEDVSSSPLPFDYFTSSGDDQSGDDQDVRPHAVGSLDTSSADGTVSEPPRGARDVLVQGDGSMSEPLPGALAVPAYVEIPAPTSLPTIPVPTSLPTVPVPMPLPLPVELTVPAHDEIPASALQAAPPAPRVRTRRRNSLELLLGDRTREEVLNYKRDNGNRTNR